MWGHRFMMPQPSGKMWGLCIWQSERRLGAVVFSLSCERIRKRSARDNEDVYVKIYQSFFSVHEIDHLSNIPMNRTTASGEFRREKRTIKRTSTRRPSIGLIFREVTCVVFRDMQQMSHNHSMFFIIICLYIIIQL